MNLAAAIALGALTGGGAWVLLAGLRSRRPRLAEAIARLHAEDTGTTVGPVVGLLSRLGLPSAKTRADLACLGKSIEDHLRRQALMVVAALLTPGLLTGLAALVGVGLGWALPVWAGLLLAVLAYALGEITVRQAAEAARGEYRRVLATYLDLMVISLAGGAGLETALHETARAGVTGPWQTIAALLDRARLLGQTPWEALAEFGERIGVVEYAQLAATVGLAGEEGARVRASLAARAETMRTARIAAIEAEAASATERMSMPIVALAGAFLLLILYPAMHAVLTGL